MLFLVLLVDLVVLVLMSNWEKLQKLLFVIAFTHVLLIGKKQEACRNLTSSL